PSFKHPGSVELRLGSRYESSWRRWLIRERLHVTYDTDNFARHFAGIYLLPKSTSAWKMGASECFINDDHSIGAGGVAEGENAAFTHGDPQSREKSRGHFAIVATVEFVGI